MAFNLNACFIGSGVDANKKRFPLKGKKSKGVRNLLNTTLKLSNFLLVVCVLLDYCRNIAHSIMVQNVYYCMQVSNHNCVQQQITKSFFPFQTEQ